MHDRQTDSFDWDTNPHTPRLYCKPAPPLLLPRHKLAGGGAGRSELASHSLSGSATQAAEQSDHSPNAVVCHVTVVS